MKIVNPFYDFLNDEETFFEKEKRGELRKSSIYSKDNITNLLEQNHLNQHHGCNHGTNKSEEPAFLQKLTDIATKKEEIEKGEGDKNKHEYKILKNAKLNRS